MNTKQSSFNVPVHEMSSSSMAKANKAMRGGKPSVQVKVDQPDPGVPGDNLRRSKQTVLPTMTKPAVRATPPQMVNPMQRPGNNANKSNNRG